MVGLDAAGKTSESDFDFPFERAPDLFSNSYYSHSL
jgi:hypothetical protein